MATIILPAVSFGDIYIIYAKWILALNMKCFLLRQFEAGMKYKIITFHVNESNVTIYIWISLFKLDITLTG